MFATYRPATGVSKPGIVRANVGVTIGWAKGAAKLQHSRIQDRSKPRFRRRKPGRTRAGPPGAGGGAAPTKPALCPPSPVLKTNSPLPAPSPNGRYSRRVHDRPAELNDPPAQGAVEDVEATVEVPQRRRPAM